MNYRDFRGNKVAEVGLGTWQLGSSEWGNVNEEEAFSILQAYVDAGGNFIELRGPEYRFYYKCN